MSHFEEWIFYTLTYWCVRGKVYWYFWDRSTVIQCASAHINIHPSPLPTHTEGKERWGKWGRVNLAEFIVLNVSSCYCPSNYRVPQESNAIPTPWRIPICVSVPHRKDKAGIDASLQAPVLMSCGPHRHPLESEQMHRPPEGDLFLFGKVAKWCHRQPRKWGPSRGSLKEARQPKLTKFEPIIGTVVLVCLFDWLIFGLAVFVLVD